MNILFSSVSGQDLTHSIHYLRVLKRLGHKVFRFSVPASVEDAGRGLWIEAGFHPDTALEALIRLSGFEPELFLYIEPNGLIPRGMERAPFPTAAILSDTHRNLDVRLKLAKFFDHVFLHHRNYLHYFREHPAGHVHWHPCGSDMEFFHATDAERDLDLAFIGHLHADSERARLISLLAKRYRMNEQRYYLQKEIPSVYSRAKIVLNLPVGDDLTLRMFEGMSCGAMLLTRRDSNGQEVLFEEGRQFAAFSGQQELFDKIEYYLSHRAEREAIAAAGLLEIKEHNRLEHRLESLLDTVKGKPDKVAPIRRLSNTQIDRQYAWLYEYWRMVGPGFNLVREARLTKRRWLPLLMPAVRSALRVVLR